MVNVMSALMDVARYSSALTSMQHSSDWCIPTIKDIDPSNSILVKIILNRAIDGKSRHQKSENCVAEGGKVGFRVSRQRDNRRKHRHANVELFYVKVFELCNRRECLLHRRNFLFVKLGQVQIRDARHSLRQKRYSPFSY